MTGAKHGRDRSLNGGGQPTMRDVADKAGVSVMTVSRALRDDPMVLAETRDKVIAAAQQLGYRRNELARSLRVRGTSGMVGLIVTNLANPFYAELALGVETICAQRGMKLVVSNTADDVERERELVDDLAARRVDGMIVVPAGTDQRHLSPTSLRGVPVVLVARRAMGIDVDYVMLDDYAATHRIVSQLIQEGHRRIGFLGPPAAWTSAERLRGFRDAIAEAQLPLDEILLRCEQREVAAAEAAARDLLNLNDPPTALFCANSRNTIGAYRAIRGNPAQCALTGFDDFELADMLDVPVRLAAYDTKAMGRRAADLLLARIQTAEPTAAPRRQIILSTTVVEYGGPLPRHR